MSAAYDRREPESYVSPIETQKRNAMARGLPPEDVETLWEAHVRYCQERGWDLGGRAWQKLVDVHIAQLKDQQALDDKQARWAQERARKHAAQRKAKDEADAEYARHAVDLRTWLASLRQSDPRDLLAHEKALAKEEPPQGYEAAGAWVLETVAARPGRPNECPVSGCGLPVRSWKGWQGRTYRSGWCPDHEPRLEPKATT